ncbi:hypothetical protein A7C99_6718 [Trichophyton rubrum]|uniref:Aminoglycoside phosphotransferase domain-containing protein n=1 Tax=Trichophyton rubrum TaxID=5551 RepID=A0A178ERS8_TRIRU|nr:hypothetical protein A7C99_6718 [Trichophyton rubrum]
MAQAQKESKAARFNIHTLKRLQKAVAADLETDLISYFPKDYSRRLSEMRTPLLPPTRSATEKDIRVFLWPSEPTAVIFPLADSVRSLLEDADVSEALYLEVHKLTVPAPRPSGLLRLNDVSLIFMTYTSTTTLADIWAGLDISQKRSIQDQLNQILTDLRSLSHPTGTPLGGQLEIQCVFTHGDLRPDNITVEPSDDYQFRVTGLLDWEYSGFYPEYYELIRSTNGLSPSVDNDWYLSYLSVFTRTLWHVVVTGLRSGGLRGPVKNIKHIVLTIPFHVTVIHRCRIGNIVHSLNVFIANRSNEDFSNIILRMFRSRILDIGLEEWMRSSSLKGYIEIIGIKTQCPTLKVVRNGVDRKQRAA